MPQSIILQSINPATDGQNVGYCNAGAFWSDDHWRHQWGNTTKQLVLEDTATRTPFSLVSGRLEQRFLKAVDSDTGNLVGYARWILPDMLQGETTWPEALIPAASNEEKAKWDTQRKSTLASNGRSRGLNFDMVRALGDPMAAGDAATRARYPGREFLELDYVAVHEEWQGKGIGKVLVRAGIEKAKSLGLNLIIMGFTNAGKGLYDGMVKTGELRPAEVVVQSCERWKEGRAEGCQCVAGFYVWIYDEMCAM